MKEPREARRSGWRRLTPLGAAIALTLLFSSCAEDAELDTLTPKGEFAKDIDNLFVPVFWVAVVVFAFVFGAVFFAALKFRSNHDEDDWPEQLHGNNALEIGWTIAPAAILAVIAVFTMGTLFKVSDKAKDPQVTVVVVGQQWWWEYRYYFGSDAYQPKRDGLDKEPDLVTATQLVIPADTVVQLYTTSRDVIHSFWIPNLNGKKDAVPGRFSPWKIQADEPGVYFGQCTEFCGLSHSRMRMQAVALTAADFEQWKTDQLKPYVPESSAAKQWLAQQKQITAGTKFTAAQTVAAPEATLAEKGMVAFRSLCSSCHLVDGVNEDIYNGAAQVSGVAPQLTHFASRTKYAGGIFSLYNADGSVDQNQLEAWLRNPVAEKEMYPQGNRGMPNLGLTEDQIDALVAFLLSTGKPPAADMTIPASEVK